MTLETKFVALGAINEAILYAKSLNPLGPTAATTAT
jgi:hypothetical protein